MARFDFSIFGVIRAGDAVDAKMFLQELIADENNHIQMPMPLNMRPIEMFEVTIQEIDE